MKFRRMLRCLSFRAAPIIKGCAYFSSFTGMYNDNPRHISEKLHEIAPDIGIYWAISDDCRETLPDYIRRVRWGSAAADRLRFSCEAVIDNYLGVSVPCGAGLFRLARPLVKRSGQLTISTWHGTPLKKIGLDDIGSNSKFYKERQLCSDFIIAGCRHTADILAGASQRTPYPIYLTGTPRNDILVNAVRSDIEGLKNKLGLPSGKKTVLFAPTFRDDAELSGAAQMRELDIKSLLALFAKRFGGDWVFVFRTHNLAADAAGIGKCGSCGVIDGNSHEDMADYLACADALITDYSSAMFDFALTGRPCFLFAPDREHYENQERGFYFDYDSLPFPHAGTNAGLLDKISSFDAQEYARGIKEFMRMTGNVEDGRASERIARCIERFLRTGEKTLETLTVPAP
ncbi:MAG: CDP-glycerol glycerophosphotransferase family protein [Synergistes sp.]|nr:CDP-glycerol glycerophosphotransferase family protein [Synergistes sp.]